MMYAILTSLNDFKHAASARAAVNTIALPQMPSSGVTVHGPQASRLASHVNQRASAVRGMRQSPGTRLKDGGAHTKPDPTFPFFYGSPVTSIARSPPSVMLCPLWKNIREIRIVSPTVTTVTPSRPSPLSYLAASPTSFAEAMILSYSGT